MTPAAPDLGRPVRVLIVDDDPLVLMGLETMLGGTTDVELVATAGDGDEVPAAVTAHRPDVVLMDIRMQRTDGLAATEALRARPDAPEVIVLTTFDTDDHVLRALLAGAAGFLLKDTPPARIIDAVTRVAAGEPMLSPAVTRRLIRTARDDASRRARAREALAAVTPRERDVAAEIARGATNGEIATRLHLSVPTVKAHITHILATLGLNNRVQIALLAHDADTAGRDGTPRGYA